MRCIECGTETVPKTINVLKERSLTNVFIKDVVRHECPNCHWAGTGFPRMEKMQLALARYLIGLERKLDPEEIVFLRDLVGWTGKEFAERIDANVATISRWVQGRQAMGRTAEIAFRLYVAASLSLKLKGLSPLLASKDFAERERVWLVFDGRTWRVSVEGQDQSADTVQPEMSTG